MDENMGTIYRMSDYRQDVVSSSGPEDNARLNFHIDGEAARSLTEAAERDGIAAGELMARALSLVLAHDELKNEGYDGPIYRRPKQLPGVLGGWLTRSGILGYERTRLRYVQSPSP